MQVYTGNDLYQQVGSQAGSAVLRGSVCVVGDSSSSSGRREGGGG